MILEIDTTILDKIENITINQLVFLSLVSNNNQKNYQSVQKLVSLIDEQEIQDLINRNLLSVQMHNDMSKTYEVTEKYKDIYNKVTDYFDELYNVYPIYVIRPDGSKGFLRANIAKCRREYLRITGKSKSMHEHITQCLNNEIQEKTMTGKLGYMKTMWKWLVNREWENEEERMKVNDSVKTTQVYGTELQ